MEISFIRNNQNKTAELINKIKVKDEKSLQLFYKTHRHSFIFFCTSRFNIIKEDAEDIYHETLLIFIDNIRNDLFNGHSNAKTYLFAIAERIILNKFRKEKKFDETFVKILNNTDDANNVSLHDDETEVPLELVSNVIKNMDEKCKEILKLFYYYNNSYKEIAQHRSASENVIKTQLKRCRGYFKEKYIEVKNRFSEVNA